MMGKGREFWDRVRDAYVRGEGSYKALAARFGASRQTVGIHGKQEAWVAGRKQKKEEEKMQTAAEKLKAAAMRVITRMESGEEADVKTIRDLAALMKELNQLAKSSEEENREQIVRVLWGEEGKRWSE